MGINIHYIFENEKKLLNKDLEISGWIRYKRVSKNFIFLTIFDGSNLNGIQVVVSRSEANFDDYQLLASAKTKLYAPIGIRASLVKNIKNDSYELFFKKMLELPTTINSENLLGKKKHGLEILRENAHFRPKMTLFQAIFRIRSELFLAIHQFLAKENFINVTTPLITTNDAEGAGEAFFLKMANNQKFWKNEFGNLTVSGQLHLESFAQAFGKVYTFGPTFRAENSNTKRHVAEFWMLEGEMAFTDYHEGMNHIEKLFKFLITTSLKKCKDELEWLEKYHQKELITPLNKLLTTKIPKITFAEAIEILEKARKTDGIYFKDQRFPSWNEDLILEEELYLAEKYFQSPVFIYDYPKNFKPFYMYQNDDQKTVRGFDLLIPFVGELAGGSQREGDFKKLSLSLKEKKLSSEKLKWYLQLRENGYANSTGYGIGFERLVMFITGIENIRDVIPFPRTPGILRY